MAAAKRKKTSPLSGRIHFLPLAILTVLVALDIFWFVSGQVMFGHSGQTSTTSRAASPRLYWIGVGFYLICTALFALGAFRKESRPRGRARRAAHWRNLPWMIFIHIPIMVGGSIVVIMQLVELYAAAHHIPTSAMPNISGLLIVLPAFFLWLPISLLLVNTGVWLVPALRRKAADHARRHHQAGYFASQRDLFIATAIIATVCIPLIVWGFLR